VNSPRPLRHHLRARADVGGAADRRRAAKAVRRVRNQQGCDRGVSACAVASRRNAGHGAASGHIVGPGWEPLNPAGNGDLDVFGKLARADPLVLPNFGLETLHHVHADDVAQAFELATLRRTVAIGESFHVTSPRAISLRGYAEAVAGWFGQ